MLNWEAGFYHWGDLMLVSLKLVVAKFIIWIGVYNSYAQTPKYENIQALYACATSVFIFICLKEACRTLDFLEDLPVFPTLICQVILRSSYFQNSLLDYFPVCWIL